MRICLLLCLAFFVGCQSSLPSDPPEVVESVDLERYAGLWYEVARLPVSFQRAGETATAHYTVNAKGTIDLVNTAIAPDGSTRSATGTAIPVPGSNNTKLKVTIDNFFAKLFGRPPDFGNYWVLKLEDDYSLALVGSPNRQTLWLLARSPEISEAQLEKYLSAARAQGYPVDDMIVHQ